MKTTATPAKVDFKKTFKGLYSSSAKAPVILKVPPLPYIMMDGFGDPNGSQLLQDIVQALYGLSYGLKFSFKKTEKPAGYYDYGVPPLEGLWWMEIPGGGFDWKRKKDWKWTLMILQPEFVTKKMVQTIAAGREKKNGKPLPLWRLEKLKEGTCVQILHIGPYDAEGPNIQKMHAYAAQEGYLLSGKHHEVYLNDPRKAAPEKLKTILRQPLVKKLS